MCVKDCGLHNFNIDIIILFAYLIGWLNFSPEKIKAQPLKNCLGLCLGWHEFRRGPGKHTGNCTRMCGFEGHNPWHTV